MNSLLRICESCNSKYLCSCYCVCLRRIVMSSLKKPGRKTINQNELRKIMLEQKKKLLESVKRIDSPLAKYSKDGQLSCILCGSIVRSEAVWSVHINSKQHKDNITNAKKRREVQAQKSISIDGKKHDCEPPTKRLKGSSSPNADEHEIKSIAIGNAIKSSKATGGLINDYNDSDEEENEPVTGSAEDNSEGKPPVKERSSETLPEGFFDDPVLDAKVRNVEYKDPIEEEWERFQRAIKEEATVSAQIIMEDQEEAIAERQIHEIEEQMRNWSRVIDLEKKKEEVGGVGVKLTQEEEDVSSSADEEEFEEYLDWRAKKS